MSAVWFIEDVFWCNVMLRKITCGRQAKKDLRETFTVMRSFSPSLKISCDKKTLQRRNCFIQDNVIDSLIWFYLINWNYRIGVQLFFHWHFLVRNLGICSPSPAWNEALVRFQKKKTQKGSFEWLRVNFRLSWKCNPETKPMKSAIEVPACALPKTQRGDGKWRTLLCWRHQKLWPVVRLARPLLRSGLGVVDQKLPVNARVWRC